MEHTAEPWQVHIEGKGVYIEPADQELNNEQTIAIMLKPGKAENARRIVACVNACAGIKTEQLETSTIFSALTNFLSNSVELETYRQHAKLLDGEVQAANQVALDAEYKRAETFKNLEVTVDIAATLHEALTFCLSVMKSQGIFDTSERLAVEKAEKALEKADNIFGSEYTKPEQNCPGCMGPCGECKEGSQ